MLKKYKLLTPQPVNKIYSSYSSVNWYILLLDSIIAYIPCIILMIRRLKRKFQSFFVIANSKKVGYTENEDRRKAVVIKRSSERVECE